MASTRDSLAVIALLGNVGKKYEKTRHNAGWMLTPFLAGDPRWQQKFKARWARERIGGSSAILLEPQTMMNRSGESVVAALRFFKVEPQDLIVVHDETELPFGEAGVRQGGGLAGHNGLKSITQAIGSKEFWRVRIGIGRPTRGDLHSHVLGRFAEDEEAVLNDILERVGTVVRDGLSDRFASAAQRFRVIAIEESGRMQ